MINQCMRRVKQLQIRIFIINKQLTIIMDKYID